MKYSIEDRTLALAGIFQAAKLVQQIGRRGMADSEIMTRSIHSLFETDAGTVSDVFGGINGVAFGLREAYRQLSGEAKQDAEVTGYLLALIQLERKLSKLPERLTKIRQGIDLTTTRLAHFPEMHSNILASLAEIYAENVSTLQPRIMVQGEAVYLQNPDNVNRIRSLLLAGIRSAMLWHQTGGRRMQIAFGRKNYLSTVKKLLDQSA